MSSAFTIKINLLVLLCMLVITSMSHERPNIISPPHLSLRNFGYDESTLEYYKRRAMLYDIGTTRVAPQGPDAQHHSISPTMS